MHQERIDHFIDEERMNFDGQQMDKRILERKWSYKVFIRKENRDRVCI